MIRISGIALPPGHDPEALLREAARLLRLPPAQILETRIVKRSVDARKKPEVRLVYTLDVRVGEREEQILRRSGCRRASIARDPEYVPPEVLPPGERPVVVGFGPAGMFAALILAMAGQRPLVLERGEDAFTRREKVERFFQTGHLDPESNVQFGEGGAGTFSDGKLNTGVNNPRSRWILERLVEAGAQADILIDAKPHVGTDVLVEVVQNIRRKIERLGGQVRFRAKVTDISVKNGTLAGLRLEGGEEIPCRRAIFAIGHSARDTYTMLWKLGIPMEPKPFSMGVRIEQLQRTIDLAQYGRLDPRLPPADYKLVRHLPDRTVYTFCMCPGGYVVAAASEQGGVVTNGMSNSDRAGENANAALLVSVSPKDFPGTDPLAGMRWQRTIEERAFALSGGYRAPAQRVGDFLAGRPSAGPGKVLPTYRPGVVWGDLRLVLPEMICQAMAQALPLLDSTLSGFADPDGVLTGPETRSSSPVRLLRGADRQSGLAGLYPAGEGAGYAGGIVSAAIDGILSAEAVLEAIKEEQA